MYYYIHRHNYTAKIKSLKQPFYWLVRLHGIA